MYHYEPTMFGGSESTNRDQPAPSSDGNRPARSRPRLSRSSRSPTMGFTELRPHPPSSASHEPKRKPGGSQYTESLCESPVDESAPPLGPLLFGGPGREEESTVSRRSSGRIRIQSPSNSTPGSSVQEENTPVATPHPRSGDRQSLSRPLRPSLRVPEEITHNVSPSTTITIRVDQPSPSTPARDSSRHNEPFQPIPHVVRSNDSESGYSPVHPEMESVNPATTITIRIDPPVPPSLNGRSPRHERPVVGFSDPIGSNVGETTPRAHSTRHRTTRRPIPPRTRGGNESQPARPLPRRRPERFDINAPPVANRISSEPHYRTPHRWTPRPETLAPTASGNRAISFPGTSQPPPSLEQRSPAPGVSGFTSPPVPANMDGASLASFRSPVPVVLNHAHPSAVPPWGVYQPPPPVSPDLPVPRAASFEVHPVAVTMSDQSVRPHPEPMPPGLILNKVDPSISAINSSLASVKEVIPVAERIPYIFPVASLLQELPKQNVVQQHQERWDVVNDKLRKVTRLVDGVVTTCANNNLEENDLPRNLYTIFQSLESQLDSIGRTTKQNENVGVVRRAFLGTYSQRKVKAYDAKLSNVLQSFQAALAFNPHFMQFAAQIEVKVTNPKARFDEDQTPLHVASQLGHVRVIRSLISRGANLNAENEDKETPLFMVSRNGHEKATKLLLQSSARVNHQDREKRTPLHRASENGHNSVTRLLLKYRADSNAKNVYDWTPLHLASRTGNSTVVRTLLRWRADIDAPNDFGWTPLHMAAQKGHQEIVELLLFKKAMVNIPEARGETALHLAAYYGHTAIVSRLIDYGADVWIPNKERKTALDLAKREGHGDVVALLEAHRWDQSRER